MTGVRMKRIRQIDESRRQIVLSLEDWGQHFKRKPGWEDIARDFFKVAGSVRTGLVGLAIRQLDMLITTLEDFQQAADAAQVIKEQILETWGVV